MSVADTNCRVEKQPSRLAHNQEIAGASPAPATTSPRHLVALSISAETALLAALCARFAGETLAETFTRLLVLEAERIGVKDLARVKERLGADDIPPVCSVNGETADLIVNDDLAGRLRDAEGFSHD